MTLNPGICFFLSKSLGQCYSRWSSKLYGWLHQLRFVAWSHWRIVRDTVASAYSWQHSRRYKLSSAHLLLGETYRVPLNSVNVVFLRLIFWNFIDFFAEVVNNLAHTVIDPFNIWWRLLPRFNTYLVFIFNCWWHFKMNLMSASQNLLIKSVHWHKVFPHNRIKLSCGSLRLKGWAHHRRGISGWLKYVSPL